MLPTVWAWAVAHTCGLRPCECVCCVCFDETDDRFVQADQERRVRAWAPFGMATLTTLAIRGWWQTTTAAAATAPLAPDVLLFSLLVFFVAFYCPMPAWISQPSTDHTDALPGGVATWVYLSGMLFAPLLAAFGHDAPPRWSVCVSVGAIRVAVWCRGDDELLQHPLVRATMVRVLAWAEGCLCVCVLVCMCVCVYPCGEKLD